MRINHKRNDQLDINESVFYCQDTKKKHKELFKRKITQSAILSLIFIILISFAVWLALHEGRAATVSYKSWERTIVLEHLVDRYESDWQLPDEEGVILRDVKTELDPQTDTYRLRYYYSRPTWTYSRSLIRCGGEGDEPKWAEYEMADNERVKFTRETYMIVLTVDEEGKESYESEHISHICSKEEWGEYSVGDTCRVRTLDGAIELTER